MIRWYLLPIALALDTCLGDPAVRWHPVRLMGGLASRLELGVRRFGGSRFCGALAWAGVVGVTLGVAQAVLTLASAIHPWLGHSAAAVLVYFSVAARDLSDHALRVESTLQHADLAAARSAVGGLVGRDTEVLDIRGITRAAVEAVAESTVDGITAPIFWACLLGPLGAIGYRAVNTLDSLWGHRDERYQHFGWAAARADDVANWLPARITVPMIALGAALLRLNPRDALRAAFRDASKHASPNSGLPEAAYAGALGVTLGGPNRYEGVWTDGPRFGILDRQPTPETLHHAIQLMWLSTWIAAGLATAVAYFIVY